MTFRRLLHNYWNIVTKNELMALGGQVTYYLILSFFPLLIVLLTLAGHINIGSQEVLQNLQYLLPENTYSMVEVIVFEVLNSRSLTLLSFGMLGALWASLNGINAMMRGIIKAYGLEEDRNFFGLRLTALLFLLIIMSAVFLSFILLIWGEPLGNWIFDLFGANSIFTYFWQKLRLLIQFIFLVLTFIILNHMATRYQYKTKMLFPGSLFSASGWIVISLAFSFYVKHFNNYTMIYGSIGGVMILLLWLYWSSEILLLGSALNALLIAERDEKGK